MAQRTAAKRTPRAGRDRGFGTPARESGPPRPLAASTFPRAAASWRLTLPCLILIAAAIFVTFRPALQNELVYWDDDTNLMENVFIRDFSAKNVRRMWTEQLLGVWQPLTWMITALEYTLFNGSDLRAFSRGLHAANIALHMVASIMVFYVARRLIGMAAPGPSGGSKEAPVASSAAPMALTAGALAAALFFALHPLRVEIVAWASGQPYILAFIPALGTVWCYLKAAETGRWHWHAAALGCLAVSLLCKAMSVPLVAVLLVLDVYPLRRIGGRVGWRGGAIRALLKEKVPYLLLTLAAAGLTVWATWANKSYRPEPLITKILVSGFCTMFYPWLALVPVTLSPETITSLSRRFDTFVPLGIAPYYMKPSPFDNADPLFVGATLAFAVVSVALILLRRRAPWLLAVWMTYLLLIAPNVGLIKHGGQMAADRYTYLSSVPWVVLIGAAVAWFWRPRPTGGTSAFRATDTAAAAACLIMLGIKTAAYCAVWKDSVSVWSAMVDRNPAYHMGYYNLAKAYKRPADAIWARRGRRDGGATPEELARAQDLFADAERCYRAAIELYPTYPEANVDLGNMMKDGKAPGGTEGAIERYETALQGRPGFHMAHLNLANAFEQAGRLDDALRHFEAAEQDAERSRDPDDRRRIPGIKKAVKRVRAKLNGDQ